MNEELTKIRFLQVMRSEREHWENLQWKVSEGERERANRAGN